MPARLNAVRTESLMLEYYPERLIFLYSKLNHPVLFVCFYLNLAQLYILFDVIYKQYFSRNMSYLTSFIP